MQFKTKCLLESCFNLNLHIVKSCSTVLYLSVDYILISGNFYIAASSQNNLAFCYPNREADYRNKYTLVLQDKLVHLCHN